ncbi:FAD-dependent oxidoreductase [Paeniglutamicibacter cryotolerans]|uniref:2-polyprenyl-6-methoxyphenol hydroxylase-like FAD-dependent oxidoreductase n=1 Tax=Paeniglutamicibacter cryotolerans TaxID=670079 RepID=A0A839QIL7_9MICC|nr:NAD(P)/FAD-dependent oxidoreductase [Paeniglutamicibacter cryotolerans]MBB2995700.1 2-polyprenyl-6-methoxyphenol hydroxylase-like FAD-dependent oxidoreductase [Paeniglutamicibacter cryotolerans]
MLDVVIVGGGPSGLTLAILLIQACMKVKVLERRPEIGSHSRAIGIHPPALDVLDLAGVGDEVVSRGIKIREGVGISRGKVIASLDFGVLPGPHKYVLALPQNETVRILRSRLHELDPEAFLGGVEFCGYTEGTQQRGLSIRTTHVGDSLGTSVAELDTRYLVGADGTQSSVRESMCLTFGGSRYPDHYVMGDYPDTTDFGSTAALFLHHDGIVESFPLPGNIRRWVAWTSASEKKDLSELVRLRTGHLADPKSCTMESQFRSSNRRVSDMVNGHVVLLGDAAHEVSPIGGQGMALGLIDAMALATILACGGDVSALLKRFSAQRLQAAKIAGRQAHLNMALGRSFPGKFSRFRDYGFQTLVSSGNIRTAVARKFTMTSLP